MSSDELRAQLNDIGRRMVARLRRDPDPDVELVDEDLEFYVAGDGCFSMRLDGEYPAPVTGELGDCLLGTLAFLEARPVPAPGSECRPPYSGSIHVGMHFRWEPRPGHPHYRVTVTRIDGYGAARLIWTVGERERVDFPIDEARFRNAVIPEA